MELKSSKYVDLVIFFTFFFSLTQERFRKSIENYVKASGHVDEVLLNELLGANPEESLKESTLADLKAGKLEVSDSSEMELCSHFWNLNTHVRRIIW